ncbi:SDR family oxidoreductase [Ktedonosporobacter rubrisoli]|uniref:SDR family oxidoreductase n=1 Tax=Ktedonosporobacter rubrisoli TaxID=2509675 RepID=A0A4P6JRD5_KTERU|nr:SDR family oxidoreductase [Ktedonosporobacter rubrisoli]QBD77894.1 SDR family oxidoreductase [Ktedonosporobacter rubrisoli]
MSLKSFEDAVTLITGAASGIGRATAQACYARGSHVILADLNEAGLQQTLQLLQQSNPSSGRQILTSCTDVADETQVQQLMQKTLQDCGHLDLVVTCAGIGRGGTIDSFTGSEMRNILDINFMGTYHCVRAALPAMRQQKSGHFVLLSSVAGKLGAPLLSAYCATKWAVRGFSIALRAELYGTGIGITTVYPAWVDTPMIHQEADPMQSLNIEALLTPAQVADSIVKAVLDDRADLTLAPNKDIARTLELMKEAPEQAEQAMGAAYYRRTHQP